MRWEFEDKNDGHHRMIYFIHHTRVNCQFLCVCVFVVYSFDLLFCLERCLFVCFILSSFYCVARCPPVGPPANLTATVQISVSAVSTDAPTLAEKVTMQLTFVVRPIQLFFSLFYNAIMIRCCSSSTYSFQNTRRKSLNREQLLLQLATAMTSQRYWIQYWTNLILMTKVTFILWLRLGHPPSETRDNSAKNDNKKNNNAAAKFVRGTSQGRQETFKQE